MLWTVCHTCVIYNEDEFSLSCLIVFRLALSVLSIPSEPLLGVGRRLVSTLTEPYPYPTKPLRQHDKILVDLGHGRFRLVCPHEYLANKDFVHARHNNCARCPLNSPDNRLYNFFDCTKVKVRNDGIGIPVLTGTEISPFFETLLCVL